MKIKISTAQAILLHIAFYRNTIKEPHNHPGSESALANLERLFLSGVITADDRKLLSHYFSLNRHLLEKYEVSEEYKIINNDDSKRYFETKLTYETLKTILDSLPSLKIIKNIKTASYFVNKGNPKMMAICIIFGRMEPLSQSQLSTFLD